MLPAASSRASSLTPAAPPRPPRPPPRRSYYNLARFNQKFERAYVEQAREDAAWARRQKEILDNERALMADVPGWVVGRRRYHTQWEDKPDKDAVDPRKLGPW